MIDKPQDHVQIAVLVPRAKCVLRKEFHEMTQRFKEVSGLDGRSWQQYCTAELLGVALKHQRPSLRDLTLFHLGIHFFSASESSYCGIGKVPVTSCCPGGRDSSRAVAASVAVQGEFYALLLRKNFHICGIHDRKWLLFSPEAWTSVPGDC